MKQLSPKEKKFVEARVKGNNQKESAILAGYDLNTEGSAKSKGYQLSKRDNIKEAIQQAFTSVDLNIIDVIGELKNILLSGKNEQAKLNAIKLYLELNGFTKEQAQRTAQKLVINIDNRVPLNNTKEIIDIKETKD